MKKALLLTLVFVSIQCSILFSQINTQLVVNKLSPYLSDWMNNPQMMTFIVNNGSGAPVDCKIKMQLYKSSGDLLAETSLPKLSIITLSPGLNQFHADEICAIPAIKYYGSSEMEILKTGKVSEDNYNLCVSLINPTTGLALNSLPPLCSMFPIVSYQLPNNITPRDNEEIFETNVRSIIFRWSPVVPAPMYLVTYKLQIWEVPAGTNGVTAIRSFQPIVDKDYRGQTQALWPNDFALPEVGKKYVWAITPFDDQGRKICDGMGMSTPYNFSIMSIGLPKGYTTPVTGTPSIIALLSPSNGSTYTLWTDEVSDTYKRKNKDSIWFSDEASLRRKDKDSTHHGFTDAEIVFNWRDDSATLQTNYTLRIVKIEKRQTALQAMQDNTAVFEAKDINSDSYTVLKKLPNGDSSINFAWQVSNGESKSEVGTFKGMISDTGYNTTGSTAPLRAPYISFIAQESNVTSALSYKLLITNNDSGSINTPQGIKISLNNDSIISIDDNLSKDWKRTPSTFPPGTGGVLWINNIGKIPTGETNLGNVQFGIPSNNSIYVAYEWLDKSGKTMYKDSVIIDVNNEVNRNKITAISPTYKNPTENLSPTFSWTYNNPNDKIPYSFRLFKLNPEDYKNTFNAMKNNKPVYSIDDITTTSLQYPANIPPLVNGEVYVWNVQPSSLQEMKHFEVFVGGNTRILAAEDCENCKNCTGKCVWDEKCNCFCYVTLPTDPHPMGTFIISKGKTPDTCIFRKK